MIRLPSCPLPPVPPVRGDLTAHQRASRGHPRPASRAERPRVHHRRRLRLRLLLLPPLTLSPLPRLCSSGLLLGRLLLGGLLLGAAFFLAAFLLAAFFSAAFLAAAFSAAFLAAASSAAFFSAASFAADGFDVGSTATLGVLTGAAAGVLVCTIEDEGCAGADGGVATAPRPIRPTSAAAGTQTTGRRWAGGLTQNFQPAGAGAQLGSGSHPAGGRQPDGGGGQPGGEFQRFIPGPPVVLPARAAPSTALHHHPAHLELQRVSTNMSGPA